MYYFRFLLENSSDLHFLRGGGGSRCLRWAQGEVCGSGVPCGFLGGIFRYSDILLAARPRKESFHRRDRQTQPHSLAF